MPRDKQGWRVAPAPDGRGMPEEHKPRPPHRLRGFWWFVIALLAINWLSVLIVKPATTGQARVTVSFSPFFLNQLQGGNVASISSKGDTIDGTFKAKVTYPPTSKTANPTTLFATQVPAFWNDTQLTQLLRSERVEVNAKSTVQSTSILAEILLGFGPTILLVGCSCCLPGGPSLAPAGSAGWVTSAARRLDGSIRSRSG